MAQTHDIILIGGGCSSMQWLQLFTMARPDHELRIMVIDRNVNPPARTWCFWEKDEHPFSHLVSHSWNRLRFASHRSDKTESIAPYSYQYIAGQDFFDHALGLISRDDRVTRLIAPVTDTLRIGNLTHVITPQGRFSAPVVYSSVPNTGKMNGAANQIKNGLWQHFRGWYVETSVPAFDPETATLMDFRTSQKNDVVFHYVLPFSETSALVECTVFGKPVWQENEYDNRLKSYIGDYITPTYSITRTEQGRIPMSGADFSKFAFEGTIPIGTAAGHVKPSTGYMFLRSMKRLGQMIKDGRNGDSSSRFKFYDELLLGIIEHEPEKVSHIMDRLFTRNSFSHVLRFLDENTGPAEDIRMFAVLPYLPFLKQLPGYLLSRSPHEA